MLEALFLDRDGIINEVVMRKEVVGSPRNLQELKLRIEFISFYEKISTLNIPLFVVSNQPDVSRNLMTQKNLDLITQFLLQKFPKLQFSYCLHDDQDHCNCRKPKSGMLEEVLKKYHFNAPNCMIIGDSYKDIEAGHSAKMKTAFLRTSYNRMQKSNPHFQIHELNELIALL